MYSVFVKVLRTDQGENIVREHQSDKNVQIVYENISVQALKSTKAFLNSSNLLLKC